jgi:hypothetical protein
MVSFGLCGLLIATNPSTPQAYEATASNTPTSPNRTILM